MEDRETLLAEGKHRKMKFKSCIAPNIMWDVTQVSIAVYVITWKTVPAVKIHENPQIQIVRD